MIGVATAPDRRFDADDGASLAVGADPVVTPAVAVLDQLSVGSPVVQGLL